MCSMGFSRLPVRAFARALHSQRVLKDVLVIGGGAAGLSLVSMLKHSPKTKSLDIALVDGQPIASKFERWAEEAELKELENRVISLTPKSVENLDKIGAWQFVVQNRILPYDEMRVWDGESDASIGFDGWDSKSGIIATMIENSNLQQALYRSNGTSADIMHAQVSGISTNPVTGWPVVQFSDGTEIEARLLVGADGQNSRVRQFAGIESRGWDYNRHGVVATLLLEYDDLKSVAYQRFLRTGPLAVLPMPDGKATMVWSTYPDRASWLKKLDPRALAAVINAGLRLEMVDIDYLHSLDPSASEEIVFEVEWRLNQREQDQAMDADLDANLPAYVDDVVAGSVASFPLKMRHADSYIGERVALVGDAAHATHPLSGQGLNMGQRDVSALVEALEQAVDRGLDIGSVLALEPYPRQVYTANHVLLGVNDKFHKIYSTDLWPIVKLRSAALKTVDYLGWVKQLAINQAQ